MTKHKMQIINTPNIPTHYYMHNNTQKGSVLDVNIITDKLINGGYEWNVLKLNKTNPSDYIGQSTYTVPRIYGSDHVPLILKLFEPTLFKSIIQSPIRPQLKHTRNKKLKLNWHTPKDIKQYINHVCNKLGQFYHKYKNRINITQQTINQMGYEWRVCINSIAIKWIGKLAIKNNLIRKIWANEKVVAISNKIDKILAQYKNTNKTDITLKKQCKILLKKQDQIIDEAKNQSLQKNARQMHYKNKNVWKHINYVRTFDHVQHKHIPFLECKTNNGINGYKKGDKIFDDKHKANILNNYLQW